MLVQLVMELAKSSLLSGKPAPSRPASPRLDVIALDVALDDHAPVTVSAVVLAGGGVVGL